MCSNTIGSYTCACNAGLLGDGRTCRAPVAGDLVTRTIANVAFEFSYIPGGTFMMGSPDSDAEARPDEKPQHSVALTLPFLLLRNEVTQAQYQAVMGSNPSTFRGDELPVETVGFNDAVAFCARLEQLARIIHPST
jgi:formylglycine-generating enzyme required for sulfatase activity